MIEIREYKDGDYEALDDCIEPFAGHCDTSDIKEIGVHLTAIKDGIPICTGGVVFMSDTEGEIWFRAAKDFSKTPIAMMRVLKETFSAIVDCCEINRYIARVQDRFPSGQRLVEKLGFNQVGTRDVFGFKYRIYEWVQQDC